LVSAPAPATAAPATATSAEVLASQQDIRRDALRRKGFTKTVFAGDNGAWSPGPRAGFPQTNTKLGQ
jgi:hypothetical protein